MTVLRAFLRLFVLALGLTVGLGTVAARGQCVTFDPVTISQAYDPLSTTDYVAVVTGTGQWPGTGKRELDAVFLRRNGDVLPYQLIPVRDEGGLGGTNLIYAPPGPVLKHGDGDPGELDLKFDKNDTTQTFDLQLRIPAGANLLAGTVTARFDVKYQCKPGTTGAQAQGFVLQFPVASSLQTSLVGTDPDFGEIGSLSTADVAVAPLATIERRHNMRVASTGPFEVKVQSQNNWVMTPGGGATAKASERIGYRYTVLGQQLDAGRRDFTPVRCAAVGTAGQLFPLVATLTEGGVGKVASLDYRDIVTITITPMAATTSPTVTC